LSPALSVAAVIALILIVLLLLDIAYVLGGIAKMVGNLQTGEAAVAAINQANSWLSDIEERLGKWAEEREGPDEELT
jgi:hypothetical protein